MKVQIKIGIQEGGQNNRVNSKKAFLNLIIRKKETLRWILKEYRIMKTEIIIRIEIKDKYTNKVIILLVFNCKKIKK